MTAWREWETVGTIPPRSKCVNAVDKGVSRKTYGKAEKKGLSGGCQIARDGKERSGDPEVRERKDLSLLAEQFTEYYTIGELYVNRKDFS